MGGIKESLALFKFPSSSQKSLHLMGLRSTSVRAEQRFAEPLAPLAYLYPLAAKLFLFITEVLKRQPAIRHQRFRLEPQFLKNSASKVHINLLVFQ